MSPTPSRGVLDATAGADADRADRPATRQQILDVALQLFVDDGYEGTSLREIAEQVGVTKAALYYHFASKEAILDTLLQPMLEAAAEIFPQFDGGPDAWGPGLEALVDWMLGNSPVFALVDRNHEIIHTLAESSTVFAGHLELHQRLDDLVTDPTQPLEQRVRLMCALGAAMSMMHIGEFGQFDPDELRPLLIGIIRAILTVDLSH